VELVEWKRSILLAGAGLKYVFRYRLIMKIDPKKGRLEKKGAEWNHYINLIAITHVQSTDFLKHKA
jgi:hypothetical protein